MDPVANTSRSLYPGGWPQAAIESGSVIRGEDGKETIVVRRRTMEAYEVEGRPDGRPPVLELYLRLLEAGKESKNEFRLTEKDCAELLDEAKAHYERAAYYLHVGEFGAAERDVDRARRIVEFGIEYADSKLLSGFLNPLAELEVMSESVRKPGAHPPERSSLSEKTSGDALGAPDVSTRIPSSSGIAEATFTYWGEYWTLMHQGETVQLKKFRGLEYLIFLLRHPGHEVQANEFEQVTWESVCGPGSAGNSRINKVLDEGAKAEYKRLINEIHTEQEEAERFSDGIRIAQAKEKIRTIARLIASSAGGENRESGRDAERARSAVSKRIRYSIEVISTGLPALGHHLRESVKIGYFYCYDPKPEDSIEWRVEMKVGALVAGVGD